MSHLSPDPPRRTFLSHSQLARGQAGGGGVAAGWWRVSRHFGVPKTDRATGAVTPVALLCATKGLVCCVLCGVHRGYKAGCTCHGIPMCSCCSFRCYPNSHLAAVDGDSELLCRGVCNYAPQIYYAVNPSLRGKNACKTQEDGVSEGGSP